MFINYDNYDLVDIVDENDEEVLAHMGLNKKVEIDHWPINTESHLWHCANVDNTATLVNSDIDFV